MQVAEQNHEAFAAYVHRLASHVEAYEGVNPFWADIYAAVGTVEAHAAPGELVAQLNKAPRAGYLVAPISPETFAAKWTKIGWALDALDRGGITADMPPGVHPEAAMAAWFMRACGRFEDAERVLRQSRLAPTLNSIQHAYRAQQIVKALGPGPVDALEIGAGGSTLKIILRSILGDRLRSHTIIDLPQMLCLSISAAMSFFPDERISIGVEDAADARHVFVPAADADRLLPTGRRYNLAINTHSFQEMDPGVIAGYFDLIYASAAPDALFFNTNWRQAAMTRLDGRRYDNDPAHYPYRTDDRVIFDGPDPFQKTLSKQFGYKAKTPGRTSIRRIGRAS